MMKCSEIVELQEKCSVSVALKPCEFYEKETGECLKHKEAQS